MQDTKDGPVPGMQVEETLSEKKSRASKVRWTRQKALELGLTLLEEQRQQPPAITPAKEPPPTDPAVWQAKLREIFWNGLLDADEKVLGYLAKLFNVSLTEEIDLQLTPDELELIRRHRKWKALDADAQHRELEKTMDSVSVLPLWKAHWKWNPALRAWQPRRETYRCPECGEVLYEYSAPPETQAATRDFTSPTQ